MESAGVVLDGEKEEGETKETQNAKRMSIRFPDIFIVGWIWTDNL